MIPWPALGASALAGPLVQGLALALALATGLLTARLLWPAGQPVPLAHFLRSPRQQMLLAHACGLGQRPVLPGRLLARVRGRLRQNDLEWLHPLVLLALSLACAGGGALLTGALLPAPYAGTVGALCVTGPWSALGWRERRLRAALEAQIAPALQDGATAAATGATVLQALQAMALHTTEEPLAGLLRRTVRAVDPTTGLADQGIVQALEVLSARLDSVAFTQAVQAIRIAMEHNQVSLASSLEPVIRLAQAERAFQAELVADYAYPRAAARLIFVALPAVCLVALQGLTPSLVAAAYGGPLGWSVAAGVVLWCALGYYLALGPERAARRPPGERR